MNFRDIPEIAHVWKSGLGGVKGEHRDTIRCDDTRSLSGSCDIDSAYAQTEGNAARWDYGIELVRGRRKALAFIEVHPASSTRNPDEVVEKSCWLESLLARNSITTKRKKWWIATGAHIVKPSATAKAKLAQAGVIGPVRIASKVCDMESY